MDDALACIGGIKDTPYAWKKYKQYLEFLAGDEPEQRAQNFELFSKGWCVGSDKFRKEQLKELEKKGSDKERLELLGVKVSELTELNDERWEEQLNGYARKFKTDLDALVTKKSSTQKVMLATLMKRRTSASNRWLSERLQIGVPNNVSQFVSRFESKPSRELKKVNEYLSKVTT